MKAFYVDFVLPLENNLEKDTKVVHLEQKKFVQLHKQRVESFNKGELSLLVDDPQFYIQIICHSFAATSNMKKHRKKKNNAEKELKVGPGVL